MRPTLALASVLTVSVLALAACNREQPAQKADPAPAAQTGASARALSYTSKNQYADVSLTLPEALKTQPAFHAGLYDEEVRKLAQFSEGAQGELGEEEGEGGARQAFEKSVAFTTALETGRLLSLKKVDFEFAGGAHPNTLTSGLLWDKISQRRIAFADLFGARSDTTVLDQALCSALNTAKRARVPGSASLTLGETKAGDFSCPKASATEFVLAGSSTGGKAGGLVFLIGPYQAGPYVEGAYELAVPLSVFRSLLTPEYAAEFDGAPPRIGDVTPKA